MLERCPRCNSVWAEAKAINGGPSEFWLECTNPSCNTYHNTYTPQHHQQSFHKDPHRFTGNFGGYGSGKTLTSREEIFKHIFLTPSGNTLIGANVASQYEQTIKREMEADLPAAFVRNVNTQKQYMDMINNHRVMFRPYDDPNKLRSYNLTSFLIVEASEVKKESFTQLKTRLRNTACTVPFKNADGSIKYKRAQNGVKIPEIEFNWAKGIIESNPSAGWIREDVLMVSSDIQKHGEVVDEYNVNATVADPAISTHVTSTSANEFLPPNFIENNVKNKPIWWTNRYIYGSFLYAEGLVYPSAQNHIVPAFPVPPEWKRIIAFDYGLTDDAVFLFGAVDEKNGILYIYKEVRVNNKNIEELAALFKTASADIPVGGLITSPIIDPKSGPKRDYDKKTLSDHFLDFGISFKPGAINVDARIFRLNTYFESGKLKVMDCCEALNKELAAYKFKADETEVSGFTGKPEDKNNHGINALEWITMEMPADPRNLVYGIYDKMGRDLTQELKESNPEAFALSDYDYYNEQYTSMRETAFGVSDYNYGCW